MIASKIDEAANVYIPVIALGELYFGAELVSDNSKYRLGRLFENEDDLIKKALRKLPGKALRNEIDVLIYNYIISL